MPRSRLRSELALLHSAWIAGLIVLALNDHVLKGAGLLPGAVTGKLSDIAGLFVAPALLAALLRVRSARGWLASAAVVSVAFSALNLSDAVAHGWTSALGLVGIAFRVWPDPTDLLALPAVALSWVVLRGAMVAGTCTVRSSRSWVLAAASGAALCVGSSPWPTAAPVVDAHQVYVEHHGGGVFAVDATSGALRGRVPTAGDNIFPPAVQDGIVYWMDGVGRLQAASAAPPHNQWIVYDGGEPARWSEVCAIDPYRVYVFSFAEPSQLIAIDRTTGAEQWKVSVGWFRFPVVTVEKDTVLFVNGPRVWALDALTGQAQWSFEAGHDLGRPTVTGDRVYVADDGGKLREIDLAEGKELWSMELEGAGCATFFPIAVDGSTAFVCADNELRAIDLSTRKARWSRDCRGAAMAGGAVACVDGDELMAFDRGSGAPRWKTQVDDTIWSAPVAGDGMVFVRNHVGKLYALRADTGALAWTLDMDEGQVTVAAGAP